MQALTAKAPSITKRISVKNPVTAISSKDRNQNANSVPRSPPRRGKAKCQFCHGADRFRALRSERDDEKLPTLARARTRQRRRPGVVRCKELSARSRKLAAVH
jgi:hypothetical protein